MKPIAVSASVNAARCMLSGRARHPMNRILTHDAILGNHAVTCDVTSLLLGHPQTTSNIEQQVAYVAVTWDEQGSSPIISTDSLVSKIRPSISAKTDSDQYAGNHASVGKNDRLRPSAIAVDECQIGASSA